MINLPTNQISRLDFYVAMAMQALISADAIGAGHTVAGIALAAKNIGIQTMNAVDEERSFLPPKPHYEKVSTNENGTNN